MSGSVLDPSIALRAGQGVTPMQNPLLTMGQFAQTQNAMNQNKLFQGQRAAGAAYQGAIGADGAFDPNKFRQLLAADPNAASAAGASVESAQALQGQQQDQALKSRAAVDSALGGLLSANNGAGPSFGQVQQALSSGVSGGWLQPQTAKSVLIGMPQADDPQSMATRTHMLQTVQQQLASPQEQLNNAYSTAGTMSNNQGIQPGRIGGILSPTPGAFTPSGQATPLLLSPGEKTGTQAAVGGDGKPGTQSVGSKYDAQGNLKPPGWGLNNGKYAPPGNAKPASQPPGTQSGPPGAMPPAAPPAAGSQAPNQVAGDPPGFTPTGLAPGEAEAQQAAKLAAAQAGTDIYKQAGDAVTMKSQLNNMQADLNSMQATGPGSDRLAAANAITQKYGGFGITMSAAELASSEGFAKIGKQIALAQSGALGAGTDEKLTTSLGANPNRDLSTMGNQQIIAMLKGNADAIAARGAAYNQWLQAGNSPANANSFKTEFNKTFDPRVYQWGYQIASMTPAQRAAAYNALPDKAAFRQNYNTAVQQGLLNPNAQQ